MSDDQDGPRGLKNNSKRLSLDEPWCSRLHDTVSVHVFAIKVSNISDFPASNDGRR